MNLLDKFQKGADTYTYQRLSTDYKVNIFLGYNNQGQMSLAITEPGSIETVQSTKEIAVRMGLRNDGKVSLTFDLVNSDSQTLFLTLCKDLITVCEKAGSSKAISAALGRWKHWLEMMRRQPQGILDQLKIRGLIAELIILKDYLIPKYGETDAVISWMGPLLGHKDFEIENTWYEVKSCAESALKVEISSIEQLESDVPGHLAVVKLEKSNMAAGNTVNLNSMVDAVRSALSREDTLSALNFKLRTAGYYYNQEYDSYNYSMKGQALFSVAGDFPRLRRSDISPYIGEAKYSILISGLADYLEVE